MTIKVRNVNSSIALSVEIVNLRNREKRDICLQPKGSVTLPRDYIVDPNYHARHKKDLRIIQR